MNQILSVADVLELIDPVDPDNLQHLRNGVYLAKWAPPTLPVDVLLLKGTPGITITRAEYEPPDLPGWIAVEFTVE